VGAAGTRVSALEDATGFLFRTAMNVFHNWARRAAVAARKALGLADRGDRFSTRRHASATARSGREAPSVRRAMSSSRPWAGRQQARRAVGCLDVAICADLVDPGRVNIFGALGVAGGAGDLPQPRPDTEERLAMHPVYV
jgi:hypothetical protein